MDSTQVFGAFTILFLVFSIPIPGKIRFFNEISPFQRSAAVRSGGGAVAPLSNGGSRRRTKAEGTDFPFLFSEEPSERSAFSQLESQGFIGQHKEEDGEEPVGTSGETVSRRLVQDLSDVQPVEALGTTFFGTRQESNIENIKQPEPMSISIFAARIPQTPLQAPPRTADAATQTSRTPLIVVTSSSSAGSAVGQGLPMLLNAEESFVSNFDGGERNFKSMRKIRIERLARVMHFRGAGDLSIVALHDGADESQNTSPAYNFSASCGNLFFGEDYFLKKPNAQKARSLDDATLSSNSLKKDSSTFRSSRRKSLSDSRLFERY
ncbi:MAG: hypothetical protein ACRC4G_00670 [Alphaproteobacteria bacterium]